MCLSNWNFNLKRPSLPLLIKGIVLLCLSYRVDAKNFGAFTEYGTILTLTGSQLLALNRLNLDHASSTAQSYRFQNCSERCSTAEPQQSLPKGSNSSCGNETGRILDGSNGEIASRDPCKGHAESLGIEDKIRTLTATTPNLNVLYVDLPSDSNTSAIFRTARSHSHGKTDTDVDSVNIKQVFSMDGRIFKKKIKNFFKNKLLLSFIALIVIIKLIKIKLFWLLPIIVGVGTAKKLLLNFILFVFPALSHLFKLCSTFQAEKLHESKYHLHQHKIVHHYAPIKNYPDWHKGHGSSSSVFIPNGPELIFTRPPKGNIPIFHHKKYAPAATYYRQPSVTTDWEVSGPGLGPEYIGDVNRNDQTIEQNILLTRGNEGINKQNSENIPGPVKNINKDQYIYGLQLMQNKDQFSLHSLADESASKDLLWSNNIQDDGVVKNNEQLEIVPSKFFSEILQRIDEIFKLFGPLEERCKRLLVCRMYQNPNKFRPYSNFISAELSRDVSDLKKSTAMNDEILRFLNFVEAARIGQEEKDCSHLLNECSAVQELPSW